MYHLNLITNFIS